MENPRSVRVVLAAYDVPGVIAIQTLFARGLEPDCIRLLTHPLDVRNQTLIDFAWAWKIETSFAPAKSEETSRWIAEFGPHVLFAMHYSEMIPPSVLELCSLGAANLHPSLLPRYRGCFSTPWAILNGESETGFTWHRMTDSFDAGAVLVQERTAIRGDDTHFSLYHRLLHEGMRAFERVFDLVVHEKAPGVESEGEGSYFGNRLPYDGVIDSVWDEARIERFIRAMYFPPENYAKLATPKGLAEVRSMEDYRRLAAT